MRLLTFLFVLIFVQADAQKRLQFSETVSVSGPSTPDELYTRVRQWYSNNAKYSKELKLVRYRDGELKWTVTLPFTSTAVTGSETVNGQISFEVNVHVLQNAYSYSVTDFRHQSALGKGGKYPPIHFEYITTDALPKLKAKTWGTTWNESVYNEMKALVNGYANPLVQSLKAAMAQPAVKVSYVHTPDKQMTLGSKEQITGSVKVHQPVERALNWFNTLYPETGYVKMVDNARGFLFGTASIPYRGEDLAEGDIYFDVVVKIAPDAYEYEYLNFYHKAAAKSVVGCSFGAITVDTICPYIPAFTPGRAWDNQVWDDIRLTIIDHYYNSSQILKAFLLVPAGSTPEYYTNTIRFTEAVQLTPEVTQQELYNRARDWFAGSTKNPNIELDFTDRENGGFVAVGKLPYTSKAEPANTDVHGYITFEVRVTVANGKYNYTFSNFKHRSKANETATPITPNDCNTARLYYSANGFECEVWTDIQNAAATGTQVLVSSLKAAMLTPARNW